MIIDHIGFAVSDYDKSKHFFCRVLAPLGIELVMEVRGWAGFGKGANRSFGSGWAGTSKRRPNPRRRLDT